MIWIGHVHVDVLRTTYTVFCHPPIQDSMRPTLETTREQVKN
jgi:hypothetical protein